MPLKIITSTPEEIASIKAIEKARIPSIDFDVFKYVFQGNNLVIDNITLYHPTAKEIIEFGEEKYLNLVTLITMRAYDERVALYDSGLNYQEISDFDIFARNVRSIPLEMSNIVFGDLPLNQFQLLVHKETKEPVLYYFDGTTEYVIDKITYANIATFFRRINYVSNKIEYDMNDETGRQFLIDRTRAKAEYAKKANAKKKKDINFESILLNICSFVVAHGLYDDKTVQNVKIGTLYELYHRLKCYDERDDFAASLRTGFMKKEDISKGSYKLNAARSLYE